MDFMKSFKAKNGKIKIENTNYDKLSIIIDKTSSLLKYGTREDIELYYDKAKKAYSEVGFGHIVNDYIVIHLEPSDNGLSIEDICVFMNYATKVSANADKLLKILEMNKPEAKAELKRLSSLGF